jgi:hypothetical protein
MNFWHFGFLASTHVFFLLLDIGILDPYEAVRGTKYRMKRNGPQKMASGIPTAFDVSSFVASRKPGWLFCF